MNKASEMPTKTAVSFLLLKIWCSLFSNKMVVEICKNVPITNAIKYSKNSVGRLDPSAKLNIAPAKDIKA